MCQHHFGQNLSLKIISNSKTENFIIDSLGYNKTHTNAKSILEEVNKFSSYLVQTGYLENELIDSKKTNDTLYEFNFKLGTQTKSIHIYVKKASTYLPFEKDTIELPINKTESFLKQKLATDTKIFRKATKKIFNAFIVKKYSTKTI